MKKRLLKQIATIGLILVSLGIMHARTQGADGFKFSDKVVLAYYYIWFSEDSWLKDSPKVGGPGRLEGLHPLVGAYNSWEPAIIEKHMLQMKRAMLDAIAVSWWFDDKPHKTNETLDTIFEKACQHGLKVTIDYEKGGSSREAIEHDLFYFLNRYKDHPAMLKVEGRPVVMIWTAWRHTPDEWQDIFDSIRAQGIDPFPIMSGSYQDGGGKAYLGPFRSLEEYTLVDVEDCQLGEFMKTMRGYIDEYNATKGRRTGILAQHHATISPGYDESKNAGRRDAKGGYKGAGWKDRHKFGVNYPDDPIGAYYRGTFEAAMQSNPDWLHVSTFNELAEFSHIEATFENGYAYLDLTAEFVKTFKGKQTLETSPENP
jgi:Glycosyl hydrolase family 99